MNHLDFKITDSEWEVMRVVWANEKITSKEIIDVLQQKMDWGTATIKTFIGRLVKKGMIETEKHGNKFIYSPKIKETDLIRSTLDDTFNNICNKDVGNTIVGLIEKSILSFDDIKNIEKVLEMKKEHAVDKVPCNCSPGQCHCQIAS